MIYERRLEVALISSGIIRPPELERSRSLA